MSAITRKVQARLGAITPVWWGILFIFVVSWVFATTQSSFNMFVFNTVLLGCIGALSLNLLMGTAGQVSIGNAAFLGAGAFISYWLLDLGLAFPLNVILAGPICGLLGLVVALPALRLHGLHLALATLAAHFIFIYLATKYQGGRYGFSIDTLFLSKGLESSQRYWILVLALVVAVLVLGMSRLMKDNSGRTWRMIRDHQVAAPAFGISVVRYKLVVFGISSTLIGIQGGLTAHLLGHVDVTSFTLNVAIQYIAMVLVGGMDSVPGSIIGASIVISLPHVTPALLDKVFRSKLDSTDTPSVSLMIYGALIIIFVVSSSRGIIGWMTTTRDGALRAIRSRRLGARVNTGGDV